jgi:hypothetical protein
VKLRDRLADVMRAEAAGKSLAEGEQQRVHVLAMRRDGTLYELGHISANLVYQDPAGAKILIERIKFGRN